MGNPNNNNHDIWKKVKEWFCKHRYGMITLAIIVAAFIIPLFIDWAIIGNDIPSHLTNGEWASFLGSFLGGIATMLAVVLTLRHNEKQRLREEKQREEEKKEEKRVYLDLVFHWNSTIKRLRDYETDKAKIVYLFDNEEEIAEFAHCTTMQIINKSKNQIYDVKIRLETTDQKDMPHIYNSTIPIISADELTFIVLPKPTYKVSGGRIVKTLELSAEKPDESVKAITITYRTEAGESIELKVVDQIHYSYSILGNVIMSYSCLSEGKYLVPKS